MPALSRLALVFVLLAPAGALAAVELERFELADGRSLTGVLEPREGDRVAIRIWWREQLSGAVIVRRSEIVERAPAAAVEAEAESVAQPVPAAAARATEAAAAAARDAAIVAHALAADAAVESEPARLAAYLAEVGAHPRDRARALYVWIAEHIAYDWEGREAGILVNDAETAWRERKAVCGGFAELYRQLGAEMGLRVQSIVGYARGTGVQPVAGPAADLGPNHAWNAVWWDDAWHLVDVTWGSPQGDRGERVAGAQATRVDRYFDIAPEAFISTHLPLEERWQLLAEPVSAVRFHRSARWWPLAEELGVRAPAYDGDRLVVAGPSVFELEAPLGVRVIARLTRLDGSELPEGHAFVVRHERTRRVLLSPPEDGAYLLRLYGRRTERAGEVYGALVALQVVAEGVTTVERYPETRSGYNDFGALVTSPVQHRLPAAELAVFRLRVPGARRVSVINDGEWYRLSARDGWFIGHFRPRAGALTVVASRASAGGEHAALLVYEVGP